MQDGDFIYYGLLAGLGGAVVGAGVGGHLAGGLGALAGVLLGPVVGWIGFGVVVTIDEKFFTGRLRRREADELMDRINAQHEAWKEQQRGNSH